MNYLAHAVLAGTDPGIIAGSLAGDFVKGIVREGDYPNAYLLGIRLHRRIDAFSNSEPSLRASADRVPPALRRIAPPCIDLVADHLLARAIDADPATFLPATMLDTPPPEDALRHYENKLHALLKDHNKLTGPAAQRFFRHAQSSHLFSDYRTFERTSRGIAYVCERLRRPNDTIAMIAAIAENMTALEEDFAHYWPTLQDEAENFLRQQTTLKT